jgi:uncharacterized membrane protein (DUF2068 family)
MPKAGLAEWLLAHVSTSQRASEVIGDLLEQKTSPTQFWLTIARIFVALAWRWILGVGGELMKRSVWAVGATALHVCGGTFLLGISSYLWLLTLSSKIGQGANADKVRGLRNAASMLGVSGLLVIIGAYGLWKTKLWGWWLVFIVDLAWSSMFFYAIIDDGWANIHYDLVLRFAISLFLMLFLVLPRVRKSFWRKGFSAPESPANSTPAGC